MQHKSLRPPNSCLFISIEGTFYLKVWSDCLVRMWRSIVWPAVIRSFSIYTAIPVRERQDIGWKCTNYYNPSITISSLSTIEVSHRVELLQLLCISWSNQRWIGFAESSPVSMSEDGAVTDATSVWNYIRKYSTVKSSLIIWGHSLGTA